MAQDGVDVTLFGSNGASAAAKAKDLLNAAAGQIIVYLLSQGQYSLQNSVLCIIHSMCI